MRHLDAADKARAYALRLLALRPRTGHELRQKLAARYSPDIVDATIAAMRAMGYMDDAAFAAWWLDYRQRTTPRGAAMLRRELSARGVPRQHIDAALSGLDGDAEEKAARAAAASFSRRLANADRKAFHRRLLGHMQRRGFGRAVSVHVARRLWDERERL